MFVCFGIVEQSFIFMLILRIILFLLIKEISKSSMILGFIFLIVVLHMEYLKFPNNSTTL